MLAALSLSPLISSPIALLLGILFINIFKTTPGFVKDLTKPLLQYSIVGLGFAINFQEAVKAGAEGFWLTAGTITLVFVSGYLFSKLLKVESKISQLISAGTAICGGSAIAAVAPVIKADSKQTSVALGVVFLLNALALFIFPQLGVLLNLSQNQFGIWSAIAIHDTSSVVGAASKFGDEALKVATTVKLARALWIVPLALVFSYIFNRGKSKITLPYFIFYFILAILAGTYLPFLEDVKPVVSGISKAFLKLALFFIGTALLLKMLKSLGLKPMLLALMLWVVISITSLWAVLQFIK